MNNPPHAPQPFGNLGVAHHPAAAHPALPPLVVRWVKFALAIFVLTFITMLIQDVVALMLKPSRGSRAAPLPRAPVPDVHASRNSFAPSALPASLGVPSVSPGFHAHSFAVSPLPGSALQPSLSIQCEKIVIVMGGEGGEFDEGDETGAGARTWWESSEAGGKTRRKSFKHSGRVAKKVGRGKRT
jgi:hypothetical protein